MFQFSRFGGKLEELPESSSNRTTLGCLLLFSSTSETKGHPTGKSPPRLDNYLHKLEEISRTRNPALVRTQTAHFRKSKIILRRNRGE